MEDQTRTQIESLIKDNRIMLFMKGTPQGPQCGFSAQVVDILSREQVEFGALNVLEHPAIREGIKEFTDWPTIPQLYVDGEFVGGCDIITELYSSGQLSGVLAGEN